MCRKCDDKEKKNSYEIEVPVALKALPIFIPPQLRRYVQQHLRVPTGIMIPKGKKYYRVTSVVADYMVARIDGIKERVQ